MSNIRNLSQHNEKVYLNVYDLHENNDMLHPFGFGLFHSGVQIGREEYTFAGGAGIFSHTAKTAPGGIKLRESVDMGSYNGTTREIDLIINELRPRFKGSDYHVIGNNCNSFANEFLLRLLGKGSPAYVNRMAYYGSFFSCLLPEALTSQDPTQTQSTGPASNGGRYGQNSQIAKTKNPLAQSSSNHSPFSNTGGVRLGEAGTPSSNCNNNDMDRKERMKSAALQRMAAQQQHK